MVQLRKCLLSYIKIDIAWHEVGGKETMVPTDVNKMSQPSTCETTHKCEPNHERLLDDHKLNGSDAREVD